MAGAIAVVSAPAPAEAGLFDFLFGGGFDRPAAPRYAPDDSSLGVKVNPRRKRGTEARRGGDGSKAVRQKPIDVATTPNWYLVDPTLRRGDIVVLKTGVFVFDGGRQPATRQDFTALSKSRLVSKSERDRIQKMAGPGLQTASADTPDGKDALPKEAALRSP